MREVIAVQPVRREQDLVRARQMGRDVAKLLGFDGQWQTRLATAVSEIARNAARYGGGGSVEFSVEVDAPQRLWIRISDSGPGIPHIDDVLNGRYRSATGMGIGILGTKRLVDEFRIETAPGRGTEVQFGQTLPHRTGSLGDLDCAGITAALKANAGNDPFEELQQQNHELLVALDELKRRQGELDRLNAELEDTNRGVMALYAELDDKAESLKLASETKTRFLSNMTHEFRTPLNSILSLSHMLLDHTDGELTPEQTRQVTYIRKSADDLSSLVNDLLDLAKVEAGKVDVRPTDFDVADLFGGLKGALRPLLASSHVTLSFDEPVGVPTLHTDEGRLTQILRNFISNALKYTERGEVRVSAVYDPCGLVTFAVRDTGVGIAAEYHERIFEEFTQIDGPLQRRIKGTGLGLPLSRKLAELLGGTIAIESAPGVGSTFSVTIPARTGGALVETALVVDDDEVARYVLKDLLNGIANTILEAGSGSEGIEMAREQRPDVVFLDLHMPEMCGDEVLTALKSEVETRDIPVIIYTSETLSDERRVELLSQAAAIVGKQSASREAAAAEIRTVLEQAGLNGDEPGKETRFA